MERKCKYCAMMIPKEAKICPHCRKRQGWTLPAKIFGWLILLGVIGAVINSFQSDKTPTQPSKPGTNVQKIHSDFGNNPEAIDFAKAMTEMAKETWPSGNIKWRLELTPQKIDLRDIVAYRKNVKYCKATISINHDEWANMTETKQRDYIKACMTVLYKPPLIQTSNVLDYYPNSSGEVSILINNKIVAIGKYSKTTSDIVFQPQ